MCLEIAHSIRWLIEAILSRCANRNKDDGDDGGLWVISPEGKHLGTIVGPEHPHNIVWGDVDCKTLYLCAKTGLYRIRLNVPGIRP